jgi:hypothetical protein
MMVVALIVFLPMLVTAADPLHTPDLTAYDPVKVLCTLGRDADGNPKIQDWCEDWTKCIKTKAIANGTEAAVKDAWDPADCREVCGVWPSMSFAQLRGKAKSSDSKDECVKSCDNFQSSLSMCVAKIMFEPGQVSAMGSSDSSNASPPAICTEKDTPCVPDLAIKHQKCLGHKTKATLDDTYTIPKAIEDACALIKSDLDDCKTCPQLDEDSQSEYAAFTGGCMDQLNAYHQATHPNAGDAAIPESKGCQVHATTTTAAPSS